MVSLDDLAEVPTLVGVPEVIKHVLASDLEFQLVDTVILFVYYLLHLEIGQTLEVRIETFVELFGLFCVACQEFDCIKNY